jgi:hypothetical protein
MEEYNACTLDCNVSDGGKFLSFGVYSNKSDILLSL